MNAEAAAADPHPGDDPVAAGRSTATPAAADAAHRTLPSPAWRLGSSSLLWVGVLLLMAVALLTAAFATQQRRETIDDETRRLEMLARVLQGETGRLLDTAALTLQTISAHAETADRVTQRMQEARHALPHLRSLWLVDGQGRVLASTEAAPGSAVPPIDRTRLALPARPGDFRLGPWLGGRDLAASGAAAATAPAGVGVLTLALMLDGGAGGGARYLVAAINPDALASQQQLLLGDTGLAAAVLDYQGQLIAGTENMAAAPGTPMPALRVLQDFLPEREHGSFSGNGLDGRSALVAFQASGRWPVFTQVEMPAELLDAAWQHKLTWTVAMMLAAMGVIGLGTVVAWRSLRMHERLRDTLEATRTRLADSEGHLRTLIEAAPAPMFVLDPLGRYTMVNQAFEDLLGVRREQLLGQRGESDPTLQQLAYHRALDHALWSGRGSGRSHYVEEIRLRGGERRQALITKVALNRPDGRPGGIIGSLTDVTSFREAEQRAAEARQSIEAAYRAESEFIGNLSHALRTPLQSIIGFSELGTLRTRRDPGLQELFTPVRQAGLRMLSVVDDLLDLSRVKSAAGTLRCTRADTAVLVEEVLGHARAEARARGQSLMLAREQVDGLASVEPLRFQQVVRALLERAIAVSPDQATIEIAASIDADGMLHWCIRDAGPTLPESEHEPMFSAFFQSRRGDVVMPGSGLELAIGRQIMRGLGGDLRCHGHPDGGNVLDLFLPSSARDTSPTTQAPAPPFEDLQKKVA